jgi:hypothetical protein
MTQSHSDTQVVEIDFELQLSDVQRGLSALPRARFSKWVGWVGVIAVISIIAWRWHEGRDARTLAFVGVLLISFFVLGRDPTKRIAKRIFEALPVDARKVHMRFDESGIQVDSGEAQLLGWSNVTRVVDTRHTLLFFASRTNAQIVPKRALTSEQLQSTRAMIARHVVTRREPWATPALIRRVLIYALVFVAIALMLYRQHH